MLVDSQANPLAYLKAIAALVGTLATTLLGTYASDTTFGKILTIVAALATAIGTYVVPNAEVVQINDDEGEPDDLSYSDLGGNEFPVYEGDGGPVYEDVHEPGDVGHPSDGDPGRY